MNNNTKFRTFTTFKNLTSLNNDFTVGSALKSTPNISLNANYSQLEITSDDEYFVKNEFIQIYHSNIETTFIYKIKFSYLKNKYFLNIDESMNLRYAIITYSSDFVGYELDRSPVSNELKTNIYNDELYSDPEPKIYLNSFVGRERYRFYPKFRNFFSVRCWDRGRTNRFQSDLASFQGKQMSPSQGILFKNIRTGKIQVSFNISYRRLDENKYIVPYTNLQDISASDNIIIDFKQWANETELLNTYGLKFIGFVNIPHLGFLIDIDPDDLWVESRSSATVIVKRDTGFLTIGLIAVDISLVKYNEIYFEPENNGELYNPNYLPLSKFKNFYNNFNIANISYINQPESPNDYLYYLRNHYYSENYSAKIWNLDFDSSLKLIASDGLVLEFSNLLIFNNNNEFNQNIINNNIATESTLRTNIMNATLGLGALNPLKTTNQFLLAEQNKGLAYESTVNNTSYNMISYDKESFEIWIENEKNNETSGTLWEGRVILIPLKMLNIANNFYKDNFLSRYGYKIQTQAGTKKPFRKSYIKLRRIIGNDIYPYPYPKPYNIFYFDNWEEKILEILEKGFFWDVVK